jgi:hypothetical protein
MAEPIPGEAIERIVGSDLTDEEVAALVDWYTNLARAVAAFPEAALKGVEPPLRSVPGPPS